MVSHDLLSHCLTDMGVCGVDLKWLIWFLHGQGHRVGFEKRLSPKNTLVCGVPQGAVLSPVLFDIYMPPPIPVAGIQIDAIDVDGLPARYHAVNVDWGFGDCARMVETKLAKTEFYEVLWLGREDSGLGCQLPALEDWLLTLPETIRSLGMILAASLSMEVDIQIMNVSDWIYCTRPGNWHPAYLTMTLPQ